MEIYDIVCICGSTNVTSYNSDMFCKSCGHIFSNDEIDNLLDQAFEDENKEEK